MKRLLEQLDRRDGAKLVIKWSKLIKYWIKIIIISNKCLYETIGLNTAPPPPWPRHTQRSHWVQYLLSWERALESYNVVEANQNKQLFLAQTHAYQVKEGKKQTINFYYIFPSFHSYFFVSSVRRLDMPFKGASSGANRPAQDNRMR